MAQRRSGVDRQSVARVRRLFRQVEPELVAEVPAVNEETGAAMLATMRSLAPLQRDVPPGHRHLRDALRARVLRRGLVLRVGLVTKRARSRFFYARFLNRGTSGYPPRNIPPMAATHFIDRPLLIHRAEHVARMKQALDLVLARLSRRGRARRPGGRR